MSYFLVDIQSVIPNIRVDLRYASTNNFLGKIVYPFQKCFLLKETALQLGKAQEELERVGLGLMVWDGFRPESVQRKLWGLLPDERYVADPSKGGRHTRGTSVDVTLIDSTGRELVMPSGFDDFTEKAHRDYTGASDEAMTNRERLEKVMERHCFVGLPTEWWHFDLIGWENYPLVSMDL